MFDNVTDEYSAVVWEGKRAIEQKKQDLLGDLRAGEYDIVIKDHPYPWTEHNSESIPSHVDEGVHHKSDVNLAAVDIDKGVIENYMFSIPEYEGDRRQKMQRFKDSVDEVNRELGTEWTVIGTLEYEEGMYNEPERDRNPEVYTSEESLANIRASEEFSELSRGLFGGFLEIGEEDKIE